MNNILNQNEWLEIMQYQKTTAVSFQNCPTQSSGSTK